MTRPRVAAVAQALCLLGAAIGALALIGWITGASSLTTIVAGQPAMKPNTGLALVLLGVAGALRPARGLRRAASLLAAAVALVIGLGTLAGYAFDIDLRIDELLFADPRGAPYSGRPSPPTAVAITLLSAAILSFDSRRTARVRPSEWLALSAALIGFTAALGQIFGAGPLYRLEHAPVSGVSVPTAAALLFASAGLLLERADAGVMRLVSSRGPGGMLLRRLAIAAALGPLLLGLISSRLLDVLGVREFALVYASLAAAATVVGLVLLTVTAVPLNRMHEALESSRARTHDLIEQAADGIFVADLQGRYTDVNGAGCRMLGYAREELVGKTIDDLIPPEETARLSGHKERLLVGGTELGEWTLLRKDGTRLPVEINAKILPDGRWQAFVRDISERKRAEEALRLSEAKFSGIVSISPDAIISIDEAQRIRLFNEGAEAIFGYSKAEVIGAPLDILIPERFRAVHRRHLERFAAGHDLARRAGERGAAIFGLRKNGEEFPADAAISRLDVGGTRVLTVSLRDVTEQKRFEREQGALARIGAVLASTLDYEATPRNVADLVVGDWADVCIVETVEEGGQVRRLRVAHRDPGRHAVADALEQVSLDRRLPHLGSSVLETKQPLLMSEVTAEYLESVSQGDEHRRALFDLGAESLIAMPLIAHGRLVGSMVLVSTTATRRYTKADLPLAEEVARRAAWAVDNARLYRMAQGATQARDDVLGVVAHDLRNPLNAIVMQAELLGRRGREAEGRCQRAGEMIRRSATRMNRLIEDLLDVVRFEAGGFVLARDRASAGALVLEAVDAQRTLAAESSLELSLDAEGELPAIYVDHDRLLQVFENLIGNAMKFTPRGGRITVGAAPRDGEVLFWVADTGRGIPIDDVPHLFDRFWQARRADRRGSAGLGLAIVKGLVEAHGGRVWVQSTPGHGSTFFFTIPALPPAEEWRGATMA